MCTWLKMNHILFLVYNVRRVLCTWFDIKNDFLSACTTCGKVWICLLLFLVSVCDGLLFVWEVVCCLCVVVCCLCVWWFVVFGECVCRFVFCVSVCGGLLFVWVCVVGVVYFVWVAFMGGVRLCSFDTLLLFSYLCVRVCVSVVVGVKENSNIR